MPPPAPYDQTLPQLSPELAKAAADTLRPAEQLTLIRADQRREWLGGRRMLAEAYLARFPDLAGDSDTVLDLLLCEYQLRAELGERPSIDEYARRFPSHGGLLRRRLADVAVPAPSIADTLPAPPRLLVAPDDAPTVPSAKRPAGPMPSVAGYEILGELGRGGMGVVYRARQKSLGREVALKMVLSGQFAGPHELERFRAEAVQLAALHHPNIVQIFEVGEFDGRPYLALEYVPGGSLSKVFETKPLAPRPAAELLEPLARAAQHAHERGIIHRDLKPANVLLAADGSPMITDFGLAKGGASLGDTATYAVLGTPSYMAPEQAGGQSRDVGPTADVYALGSILYEALTGRPPFRAATLLDTIQMVTTTEPIPPGELTVNLPRDLETITLKCLQKEPARRYPSAAELADDLRRFLDGEPIKARPVPAWEKAWKWARRRPAWAALVATVILSAAGLIGAGVWFNARLRHERDIARTERDRANENAALAEQRFQLNREAVDRYFTGVSESDLLDEPGMQPLREKLLGLAKDYYARFVAERRDDPSVRADLARSLSRLARITADLKDPPKAIELHREALPIFEQLAAAEPDDPAPRADIAGTWYELSKLYRLTNQSDSAAKACRSAISAWARLADERPGESRYRAELARSLTSKSNLEFGHGRLEPARADCEQSLALRQKLAAERPSDLAIRRDLATTWDNLANISAVAGHRAESTAARKQAGDRFRQLVADNPYRASYRNDLARVQFNLGSDLLRDGQPLPASEAFREAAEQWDRLHALHPAVRDYHVNLGNAMFAYAQAAWSAGHAAVADAALANARTARADLVRQYPTVPQYAAELARCDAEEGHHALRRGQPTAAAHAFQRAVESLTSLADKHADVPRYRLDLATQRLNLGKAWAASGRVDAGRAEIEQAQKVAAALAVTPAVAGPAAVLGVDCLVSFGDIEREGGVPAKALESYDQAIAAGTPLASQTPPLPGVRDRLRDAWAGKAQALTALGRLSDAITAWDDAIGFDDGSQRNYLKLYRLAVVAQTGDYEEALHEVDLLAGQARSDPLALFHVGRVYGFAARTAAADAKQPQADRDRRANEAAERAVENLRLAQSQGYFADPTARAALTRDTSFEALRDRADFRKLLADAENPGERRRSSPPS